MVGRQLGRCVPINMPISTFVTWQMWCTISSRCFQCLAISGVAMLAWLAEICSCEYARGILIGLWWASVSWMHKPFTSCVWVLLMTSWLNDLVISWLCDYGCWNIVLRGTQKLGTRSRRQISWFNLVQYKLSKLMGLCCVKENNCWQPWKTNMCWHWLFKAGPEVTWLK